MTQRIDFSKGLFNFMNDPYALPLGTPRLDDPSLAVSRAKAMGTVYPHVSPQDAHSVAKDSPQHRQLVINGYGSLFHLIGYDDLSSFALFSKSNPNGVQNFVHGFELKRDANAKDETTGTTATNGSVLGIPPEIARFMVPTITFEGPSAYQNVTGNTDKQGLSFGVIQWNFGQRTLQRLLNAMAKRDPQLFRDLCNGKGDELLAHCQDTSNKGVAEAVDWAKTFVCAAPTSGQLKPEWQDVFKNLGAAPAFIEEQNKDLIDNYWKQAKAIAYDQHLTTERGMALAFDIAVQNGSVKDSAQAYIDQQLKQRQASGVLVDDQQLMEIIATAVSLQSAPENRKNVLERKMAIARGGGSVNDTPYTFTLSLVPHYVSRV